MITKSQSLVALNLLTVLTENGSKLGCNFTLEYQGQTVTGKEMKVTLPVRINLNADSIPSLVSKLRDYLDGFIVVQDSKNPKIVHIIDKVLASDANHPLNKKITLNYSGSLAPTNIQTTVGFATTAGGLLAALAKNAGDIKGGSLDSTFTGMQNDTITQINIMATNETVRSILTDCLPADNYNPVMWRAVTTMRNDKKCVLVQFFGQKMN